MPVTVKRFRATHANFSGLAPREEPVMLAGYPQLSAVPYRGDLANVSEGTLILRVVGHGWHMMKSHTGRTASMKILAFSSYDSN